MAERRLVTRFDAYQRRHRWAGFPLAVAYKFFDDQGNFLAALIAYYGFISLFFLLLILVTILAFVASGNPAFQHQLLGSALAHFPIIGNQISQNVHAIRGSVITLVVALAVCIHGGLEVVQAGHNAFNRVWAVPRQDRPNPLQTRLRSAELLGVLGLGVLFTTGLSAFTVDTVRYLGEASRIATTAFSLGLNVAIYVLAFLRLTAAKLSVRQVLPGAFLAGTCWQALQSVGTFYVAHALQGADAFVGLFGVVLGLLAWIYVEAIITVICAEINVVHARKLWPRGLGSLFTDTHDLTEADLALYESYTRIERYKTFQRITVEFDPAPADPEAGPAEEDAASPPAPTPAEPPTPVPADPPSTAPAEPPTPAPAEPPRRTAEPPPGPSPPAGPQPPEPAPEAPRRARRG
ncbi:MAG: YihY/virulence factor BrkB family protein [Acidimicrobiales bacterium]